MNLDEALRIAVMLDSHDFVKEFFIQKLDKMDATSLQLFLDCGHLLNPDQLRPQVLRVLLQKDFSIKVYTRLLEQSFQKLNLGEIQKEKPIR